MNQIIIKKKAKIIAHLSFVFGVWFSVKNTAFVGILALFQASLLTIGEKGRACENLTAEDRFVNEVQVAERFKGYLLGILRTVYSGLCFLGIFPCFRSVACNQHFQVRVHQQAGWLWYLTVRFFYTWYTFLLLALLGFGLLLLPWLRNGGKRR